MVKVTKTITKPQVSSLGRFKSSFGVVSTPKPRKDGYVRVGHEAARKLGLNNGNITSCCNGRIKKTGNYEFRYGQANEVAVLEGEEWMDVIIESCKKKVVRPNLSVSFASKQVNKNRTDLKNEYCIP